MPRQNVFRDFGDAGALFRDERALEPEYLPELLPHRDAQVREIASALRGAAQGRRPENVVAVGKPGTGKTATVRFVFRQLSEYSGKAVPLYINCWEYSTRHAVLSRISHLLGEFMPRRGIAADEILDRIVEVLKKEKKVAVVALDEIDRLLAGREGEEKVLYDLLRAGETYGTPFGVIGVTNNEDFLARLDRRIRSSLAQREVAFRQYSPQELKDIIGARARLSFHEGALSPEAVPLCAAHAAKNGGDARLGIAMLWKAGKLAEQQGAEKVSAAHCKKAFAAAEASIREEQLSRLNGIERRIIGIAGESGGKGITSGELYEKLAKEFDETDRTVRNYIDKLEALKLVSVEERPRTGAQKGNTRIIRIPTA
ncbi:MAG: AAA family ATPase [Candidatus ainarchaeum sp.]|nr:AAA family ATPase [Candidatus ainarchaeum sp.]